MRGMSLADLWPEQATDLRQYVKRTLMTRQSCNYEFDVESDDGLEHFESLFVAHGRERALLIVRDVTRRKTAEAEIHELAYRDQLTGLPNRQMFLRHFERVLASARLKERNLAVLWIDLDELKQLNEIAGRDVGDTVLRMVAQRLDRRRRGADPRATAAGEREEEQLARLGGDEFAILLTDVESRSDAATAADRLLDTLREPFTLEGRELAVRASVGIALYPEDGDHIETLLQNAQTAMYDAKGAGRDRRKFYSGTVKMRSLHRRDLETELRWALRHRQLELHYQPRIELATAKVVAVEALLRWSHPLRGFVSLHEFLPLAEQTGLIVPIGEWVLGEAVAQVLRWRAEGLAPFSVAVNLAEQQLARGDLVSTVQRLLEEAGVDPALLELEIKEGLLARHTADRFATIESLGGLGVGIIIDDFGTSYSSLSQLKQLPISAVKIDRSFVMDIGSSPDARAVCSAAIAMGRALGLAVIAEGVESEVQLEFLRQQGCDEMQGFLHSEPLPPGQLEDLIRKAGDTDRVA